MKLWRAFACVLLLLVVGVSLAANRLAPEGYAKQYREVPGAPDRVPSTYADALRTDRLTRAVVAATGRGG
jgi:hypothetical protein